MIRGHLCILILLLAAVALDAKREVTAEAVTNYQAQALTVQSIKTTSLTFTWSSPNSPQPVKLYLLTLQPSGSDADDAIVQKVNGRGYAFSATFEGLVSSTSYDLTITVVYPNTVVLEVPTSLTMLSIVTLSQAPLVTLLSVGRDTATFSLAPAHASGSYPNKGYLFTVFDESGTVTYDSHYFVAPQDVSAPYTIDDLLPSNGYEVAVVAFNDAGVSESSRRVSFATSPSQLSKVHCDSTSLAAGASTTCSIHVADASGARVLAAQLNTTDFTLDALSGSVSDLTVMEETSELTFTFTAPATLEGDSAGALYVSLAHNGRFEVSGSPIYFTPAVTARVSRSAAAEHAQHNHPEASGEKTKSKGKKNANSKKQKRADKAHTSIMRANGPTHA